MIVRCKSDADQIGKLTGLTIEKYYEVIEEDEFGFMILDDIGRKFWYIKKRFYSIEEDREIKFKKILIKNDKELY